jgi:AAA15 family ATPase/GTPase
MAQMKDLKIENFRCFDSIEVNGLSKVNLFVGANNSGKSSILEAVFLTMGMSNPMIPITIGSVRGLGLKKAQENSSSLFKYMFHNVRLDKNPLFRAYFEDTSERHLTLDALYTRDPMSGLSVSIPEVNGWKMSFSLTNASKKTISSECSLSFEGIQMKTQEALNYSEPFQTTFLTVYNGDDQVALQRLSDIIKRNGGASIVSALQNFDPNIINIQPLSDGIYFNVKGVKELLPIYLMGDGIRRFLGIIVTIEEGMSSFVCIDEIENGLHYTAHKTLWKALMSYVLQHDIQLFVTTHNSETLSGLVEVLDEEEYAAMREATKVFTVAKTKLKGYQAYRYAFEEFKSVIDSNLDIRR